MKRKLKRNDPGGWYTVKLHSAGSVANVWVCEKHTDEAPGVLHHHGTRGKADEPCVVCDPEKGLGPEIAES